jgi:tryptophan 7-halogenase
MSERTNSRIVIVGGGTAGWMAAAALARFTASVYSITLIESDAIGTVGVGEATIPQIHHFNHALGIDEAEFVRETQGTFKLGIQFVDWLRPGHSYMHAFGAVGRPLGLLEFHHYWLRGQKLGVNHGLDAYSLSASAARANAFTAAVPGVNGQPTPVTYAYHFDAGLYAAFLRKYAEGLGVVRHEGNITSVDQNSETGFIQSATLANGTSVSGDIFIDCSGFRGLLIEETLNTGYDDWSHWLPSDRALAVPCASTASLTPYTRSTAKKAGWQWRIPLQHRTGNGIVYSSQYMSDDEACSVLLDGLDGEAMADPRPIAFKTGKRKKFWNRNVVALGLSGGFMEPLESTSIHLIQSGIERFLKFLPLGEIHDIDVNAYNEQCAFEFESIRDFLILHYHANERSNPFWVDCQNMAIPDSLSDKIELYRANGRIFRFNEELFTQTGWLQVMASQGIETKGHHPLVGQLSNDELSEFLALTRKHTDKMVASMPSHNAFIAQHCAAGVN